MEPRAIPEMAVLHLERLCSEIGERPVGSPGNIRATEYFRMVVSGFGWDVESHPLAVLGWKPGEAGLTCGDAALDVSPSPYAPGCDVSARLLPVSTVGELAECSMKESIILLHGEIASGQLMPKNFQFYNPPEHGRIIALLENGMPAAIISATGRNPSLAGGVYPFPLIEDGDFDIPSVFTTAEIGRELAALSGREVRLWSSSERIPSTAWNVLARKGSPSGGRIVVTAHIDAKNGTPGAIDNATGVTVLLLLAELLADSTGTPTVELVALNGEDHYSAAGQMDYIQRHMGAPEKILLNINIDGAGYREGETSFSFFDLPEDLESAARSVMASFPGIREGAPWPQGDHSIFVQYGRPAIAVSSTWFLENMDTQDITHTPKDRLDIVDPSRVVVIAEALADLVRRLSPVQLV